MATGIFSETAATNYPSIRCHNQTTAIVMNKAVKSKSLIM